MSRSETFRPLYKTLVDKIELDIIRRNLKTGDFFCVLKDLCDQYQVSIITVRKAVSILEHNGILSCKSASGIYIANRELLNTLNTFERIILIPHHHYIEHPNLFFELRLSALLQTLPQKGYVGLPIYRKDLNPERINLLGQRVVGVIGGNSMARELLPRNAASPKLMLINPPQEIAPSPQVCLCRYDFREQFRKSYEFAMRRNMPEIVRLVTDPSYHVPDRKPIPAALFPRRENGAFQSLFHAGARPVRSRLRVRRHRMPHPARELIFQRIHAFVQLYRGHRGDRAVLGSGKICLPRDLPAFRFRGGSRLSQHRAELRLRARHQDAAGVHLPSLSRRRGGPVRAHRRRSPSSSHQENTPVGLPQGD